MSKKDMRILFFLVPIFFFYSLILITPYTGGDQIHYRRFYEFAADASFLEIIAFGHSYIGGSEPLSLFILGFGAWFGINKDIYISILNTILLFLLCFFLRSKKTHWRLIFLFALSFYMVVLMTGAERLKVAYIFMLLAAVSSGKNKGISFLAAFLAHFQILIYVVSFFIAKFEGALKFFIAKCAIKRSGIRPLILVSLMVSIALFFFAEALIEKLNSYLRASSEFLEMLQVIVILVILLPISKNKIRLILAMLPFLPAVIFLGGHRVNMIAFSVAMYFIVIEGRQNFFVVYSLVFYMFLKSIPFIQNIYFYGDGFW